MVTHSPFQRARRPEQKEERRQHLLDTARTLLLGGLDVNSLSLNELARQAEMTKSNVYRYYESREAVLLDLIDEELDLWRVDFQQQLSAQPDGVRAVDALADAYAATWARRPLLCSLSSVLPSVIEHNIALERVIDFKRRYPAMVEAITSVVCTAMPMIQPAHVAEFARLSTPLLIGMWPISHPAAVVREALALPDLAPLRFDFQRDLARALRVMLRGIVAES